MPPGIQTIPISTVIPSETPVTGPTGGWMAFTAGSGYHTSWWQEWQSPAGYLEDVTNGNWYAIEDVPSGGNTVIRPSDALLYDLKTDDGIATTGNVRAIQFTARNGGLVYWGPIAAQAGCADTSTGIYAIATATPSYNLLIRASF